MRQKKKKKLRPPSVSVRFTHEITLNVESEYIHAKHIIGPKFLDSELELNKKEKHRMITDEWEISKII